MSKYILKIDLDSKDVHNLNSARQKITIVKSVEKAAGMELAWVSFAPFEQNQISWENIYALYTSNSTVQHGATIFRASSVDPVVMGTVYPLEYGTFSPPLDNEGISDAYGILNIEQSISTFGLAQSVSINGTIQEISPLNAATVMHGEKAFFKPVEKIQVFMEANLDNGMVISEVSSPRLLLDLTSNQTQSIRYDASAGQFVLA